MRTQALVSLALLAVSSVLACTSVLGTFTVEEGPTGSDGGGSDTGAPLPDSGEAGPTPSVTLDDAVAIAAGRNHTCALRAGDTVVCWGNNTDGQLAVPQQLTGSPVPVTTVLPKAKAIFAGRNFGCIREETNNLVCWGKNDCGQLGRGKVSVSEPPDRVLTKGGPPFVGTAAALGSNFTGAIDTGGDLFTWGCNPDMPNGRLGYGSSGAVVSSPTDVATLPTPVRVIALGDHHGCSIVGDPGSTAVWCWGLQLRKELAQPTDNQTYPPTKLASGVDAGVGAPQQLALGTTFSCVLEASAGQRVLCWGGNDWGQAGGATIGPGASIDLPRPVPELTGVLDIAAGDEFACARKNDGAVACWGRNDEGQLGIGTTDALPHPTPTPIPAIRNAVAISAGQKHACALVKDDPTSTGPARAVCWGWNNDGQIGDGSRERRPAPVQVAVPVTPPAP